MVQSILKTCFVGKPFTIKCKKLKKKKKSRPFEIIIYD